MAELDNLDELRQAAAFMRDVLKEFLALSNACGTFGVSYYLVLALIEATARAEGR